MANKKPSVVTKMAYRRQLRTLQIELVNLQRHLIAHEHRILVIFEGRDASGKDGTIKRIVEDEQGNIEEFSENFTMRWLRVRHSDLIFSASPFSTSTPKFNAMPMKAPAPPWYPSASEAVLPMNRCSFVTYSTGLSYICAAVNL